MGCESGNEKRHLKKSVQRQETQLTSTEKAILDCKSCRDKIKRYIRNLEQKEQKTLTKVKELLSIKQRDRAKLYLKQSKLFSEQAKIADGQLDMINQQINNIETTSNMNEYTKVLRKGNEVLQQLQNEVSIEHWDEIRDDLDELKDREKEIGDFFREKGVDENEFDEQCDEEINKIMNEIKRSKINLPNVPSEQIPEDSVENINNDKNNVKTTTNKKKKNVKIKNKVAIVE